METDDDACSFSSRKRPNYRWGLCLGHYISDKVPPEAFDINNDDFCPSESQLQQLGADGSTERDTSPFCRPLCFVHTAAEDAVDSLRDTLSSFSPTETSDFCVGHRRSHSHPPRRALRRRKTRTTMAISTTSRNNVTVARLMVMTSVFWMFRLLFVSGSIASCSDSCGTAGSGDGDIARLKG